MAIQDVYNVEFRTQHAGVVSSNSLQYEQVGERSVNPYQNGAEDLANSFLDIQNGAMAWIIAQRGAQAVTTCVIVKKIFDVSNEGIEEWVEFSNSVPEDNETLPPHQTLPWQLYSGVATSSSEPGVNRRTLFIGGVSSNLANGPMVHEDLQDIDEDNRAELFSPNPNFGNDEQIWRLVLQTGADQSEPELPLQFSAVTKMTIPLFLSDRGSRRADLCGIANVAAMSNPVNAQAK